MIRCTRQFLIPVAIALVLRLGMAAAVNTYLESADRQFLIEGDASGYWELAQKLAAGEPYAIHQPPRAVLRTPGFPLILAGFIRAFGDRIDLARYGLALLGTAACCAVALLTTAVSGRRAGVIALWIAALSPLHIGLSPLILSETAFSLGVVLSLLLTWSVCCQRTHHRPGDAAIEDLKHGSASVTGTVTSTWGLVSRAAMAGIVIGLTTLIRPGWLPWGLVAAAFLATSSGLTRKQRIWGAGCLLAGLAVALFPWALRNKSVTGHWVVTSLWSGPSLYDGLNPDATGASDMTFVDRDGLYGTMSEYDANEEYKRRAVRFATEHPGQAFRLALRKSARFLSPVLSAAEVTNPWINAGSLIWYAGFWGLVGWGFWRRQPGLRALAFLASPFGLFLLVHMVFVGSVRYRVPIELPLMAIAAAGISEQRPSRSRDTVRRGES